MCQVTKPNNRKLSIEMHALISCMGSRTNQINNEQLKEMMKYQNS